MSKQLLGTLLGVVFIATGAFGQGTPGDSCGELVVIDVVCDPAVVGSYQVTFALTNSSGTDAQRVRLLPEDADFDGLPDYAFAPDTYVGSFPNGSTTTLTTQVVGAPGSVICLEVWLLDDGFVQCCVFEVCLDLPNCSDEPEFIRCDCNRDGGEDIGDAVFMLNLLFFGGTASCADACDANDDGMFNIADPITCLTLLFGGGGPPPPPYPDCGPDPTADALDCDSFSGCP